MQFEEEESNVVASDVRRANNFVAIRKITENNVVASDVRRANNVVAICRR